MLHVGDEIVDFSHHSSSISDTIHAAWSPIETEISIGIPTKLELKFDSDSCSAKDTLDNLDVTSTDHEILAELSSVSLGTCVKVKVQPNRC